MPSIVLITLLRQATQAACQGDASAFLQIRESIETLDRLGEISQQKLDILHIIAAARMGDTQRAMDIVRRFGLLSISQHQELFSGLNACPEMAHARFREFVMQLRISARAPKVRASFLRSRMLSVVLGVLIILLTGAVVVLIEFVLPQSAAKNTHNLLSSVSQANTKLFMDSLPRSWRLALDEARLRIANSPTDPGANPMALQASLRGLSAALLNAQKSPQAQGICKALVGVSNDMEILARLAAGVQDISQSDWMNLSTWKERSPWNCTLSVNAILVWRVFLAHAPVARWSHGLFDEQYLVLPLENSVFFTSETLFQPPKTLVQVQNLDNIWQITCVQVDGAWMPVDWLQDWIKLNPWIIGKYTPAYLPSQLETNLADQINGVTSWLTRFANHSLDSLPTEKEASWWIAQ